MTECIYLQILASKFHAFNQAHKFLFNSLRRLALDAKRKDMVRELEERELAFKKAKTAEMKEEREMALEADGIKDEGRRMREERENALRMRGEAERIAQKEGRRMSHRHWVSILAPTSSP